MEFHDLYWVFLLLFLWLPFELYTALNKKKGDTFSETNWGWFAINRPNARFGKLRRFIILGFWVATAAHLVYATPVTFTVVFGAGAVWSIVFHYRYERKAWDF